ncbi:MAG: hypothetical protein V3U80_01000 [Flavobacteriaceae bacterium]
MKSIKQIISIILLVMITLSSCTKPENETLELKKLNFDINVYQKKSSYLKFIEYGDFISFKDRVLNSQGKSDNIFTEDDFNQAETLLADLGVFDNDTTPLILAENVINHLLQNNYISNKIKSFLNNKFAEGNLTYIDIQNFISSEDLSTGEIDFLNSFSNLSGNQNKSFGCWFLSNAYGAFVGASASACCTPIVGILAGGIAQSVAEEACERITNSN